MYNLYNEKFKKKNLLDVFNEIVTTYKNCYLIYAGSGDDVERLKKKAEKSGMPLGILRQVFNRGVAAWKTGHRPGTTAVQWGLARVNSFVTKSSGTWGKADKDLAKKVRGS